MSRYTYMYMGLFILYSCISVNLLDRRRDLLCNRQGLLPINHKYGTAIIDAVIYHFRVTRWCSVLPWKYQVSSIISSFNRILLHLEKSTDLF